MKRQTDNTSPGIKCQQLKKVENKFGQRWLWAKMTQNDFGGSLTFLPLNYSEVSRSKKKNGPNPSGRSRNIVVTQLGPQLELPKKAKVVISFLESDVTGTEVVFGRDDSESNHATNHFCKRAHPNNFRISSTILVQCKQDAKI